MKPVMYTQTFPINAVEEFWAIGFSQGTVLTVLTSDEFPRVEVSTPFTTTLMESVSVWQQNGAIVLIRQPGLGEEPTPLDGAIKYLASIGELFNETEQGYKILSGVTSQFTYHRDGLTERPEDYRRLTPSGEIKIENPQLFFGQGQTDGVAFIMEVTIYLPTSTPIYLEGSQCIVKGKPAQVTLVTSYGQSYVETAGSATIFATYDPKQERIGIVRNRTIIGEMSGDCNIWAIGHDVDVNRGTVSELLVRAIHSRVCLPRPQRSNDQLIMTVDDSIYFSRDYPY